MTRLWAIVVLAPALGGCSTPAATVGADDAPKAPISVAAKLDHFGYRPGDPKVAIYTADPGPVVEVRTTAGTVAFTVPKDGGAITPKGPDPATGNPIFWVDLSPLTAPGSYHLYSPSLSARSYEFEIGEGVYDKVLQAAVRTYYYQRCGTPKRATEAGAWSDEAACHRKDAQARPLAGAPDHGVLDLSGGWHDAGDYNKYVWYATSNAILFMVRAYERNPGLFADGSLRIPESGNGIPDLLDELKWETDFLLKMQLPDGSVLSQIHGLSTDNGRSPPSADTTVRYYHEPTVDAAAVFAGSCAVASRVFAAGGQTAYAERLGSAARKAWTWLVTEGDAPEKAWAAAEVFRLDPTVATARSYVDRFHPRRWAGAKLNVTAYDTHAALTYVETPGATADVVAAMRTSLASQVEEIFASDDLYRTGMPDWAYFWGSNSIHAGYGAFLLEAARLGITGKHDAPDCRRRALDFLHFFHGQNALSMVYLTNMAALGGEHSSWQIFHNWFGQSQDPGSRARFIGRAASADEPVYPYFTGADNHGVSDDKTSTLGPAPGFVPGGPNKDYTGDAYPPAGARHPSLFYRDFSDQKVWTARTWEITENSIGYQGPYVALVAAFASGPVPPGPVEARPPSPRPRKAVPGS
jgi:hypothetical protein